MIFFFSKILITVSFYTILGKIVVYKIFNNEKSDIIDISIIGIIFASIIPLIINFFLPLSLINNSIILFIIFLIFLILRLKLQKIDYLFISICSLLSFLIILYDNEYRPDAGLYHLPYIQILNEQNLLIGLTNIHTRFGHISIIQYLSAFNLNIFTNKMGIIIPISVIFSSIYLYFIYDIYKLLSKKDRFSLGKIFSVFIIIYISYKINRYSEFGNDAPAHLMFFYFISKFIYLKKFSLNDTRISYLYMIYLFLNKVFFILTFALLLYFFQKNKKLILNLLISLPTFVVILWVLKNVLISGCMIFPMKITCFNSLKWTNLELIKYAETEAEAWSKAWPQNINKNLTIEEFNKNFKWLDAWLSVHFKYVMKILLPYILLIILILFYIINLKRKSLDNLISNHKYYLLLLFSLISTIIFFLKFPTYRYGYSYLIFLLFMISVWCFKFIDKKKFLIVCKILIPLSFLVIISKQFLRFQENFSIKDYKPNHIFIDKKNYDKKYDKHLLSENFTIYYSENECFYGLAPCTNYKYGVDTKKIKYEKKLIFNIIYL